MSQQRSRKGGFTNGFGKGDHSKSRGRPEGGFTNGAGKGFTNGAGKGFTNGAGKGFTNGAGKGFTNGAGSGQGFTNGAGKGFTNGAGKGFTNGAGSGQGFTNGAGKGFTNGAGKGLTNGGGSGYAAMPIGFWPNGCDRSRLASFFAMWRSKPLYRQGTAIIVAVIMVLTIPQAVLVMMESVDRITIDGHFSDWDDIKKNTDGISDVSGKNIDLIEAATLTEHRKGFVYFRLAEGDILEGVETPESYIHDTIVMFVDYDKNPMTGYETMAGNGAEYMVQISGYGGIPRRSIVYDFNTASQPNDWAGWVDGGTAKVAVRDNMLEARLPDIMGFESVVEAYIIGADGSFDVMDNCMVNTDGATLKAGVSRLAYNELQIGMTPMMEFALTAQNGDISVTEVVATVEGTAMHKGSFRVWIQPSGGSIRYDFVHDGVAHLPIHDTIPSGEARAYVVGVDIRDGSLAGGNVRLSIASGSDIRASAMVILSKQSLKNEFSYVLSQPEGFVMDGSFGEWESIRGLSPSMVDLNENVRMDEIKATSRYGYVRVAGTMLGGTLMDIGEIITLKPREDSEPIILNSTEQAQKNETSQIRQEVWNLTKSMTDTLSCVVDGKRMIVIEGYMGNVKNAKVFIRQNGEWTFNGYTSAQCAGSELEFEVGEWHNMRVDMFDFKKRGNSIYIRFLDNVPIEGVEEYTSPTEFENATAIEPLKTPEPPQTQALAALEVLTEGFANNKTNKYGYNVSYVGDLNKDGTTDLAIGCPYWNYSGRGYCGAVFVFFGYAKFSTVYTNYANITKANVTIYGSAAGNHFGWSLSAVGDFNGDTYDDMIVGAPDTSAGNAYIFYGKGVRWRSLQSSKVWDLNSVSANVTLTGDTTGDAFGYSVSGAGNVNGDSYKDVVIGAPNNDTWSWAGTNYADNRGAVYVLNGSASPSATYTASQCGIKIYGVQSECLGSTVSSAGDFNNDGTDEIVVGGRCYVGNTGSSNTGTTIMFGAESGGYSITTNSYSCDFENAGGVTNNGWYLSGTGSITNTYSHSGTYCVRVGGSGSYILKRFSFDCMAINQLTFWWMDISFTSNGHLEIYDGRTTSVVADIANDESWNKETINMNRFNTSTFRLRFYNDDGVASRYLGVDDLNITGICGYKQVGEAGSNWFGDAIANVSDVNADGFDDVLIGAHGYNSNQGRAYLYRGSAFQQPRMKTDYLTGNAIDSTYSQAQAFTTNVNIVLWAVELRCWDAGTNSASMSVNIQTNSAGTPSGTIITNTATVDFPTSSSFQRVQFSTNPTLTAGTKYWIVATCSDANPNGYAWTFDRNNPYTGGGLSTYSGGSWSAEDTTDYDYCFAIYPMANATLTGQTAGDHFGLSIARCGDFTSSQDGKPDFVISAPYYDANDYGRVYVFNGTVTGSVSASLAEWSYTGTQANMRMGFSVSGGLMDLNDDGNADIVASAPFWDNGANVDSGYVRILARQIPEFAPIAGMAAAVLPIVILIGSRRRKGAKSNGR